MRVTMGAVPHTQRQGATVQAQTVRAAVEAERPQDQRDAVQTGSTDHTASAPTSQVTQMPYVSAVQPDQRRTYARPTDEIIRLARVDQHAKRPQVPGYNLTLPFRTQRP